MFTYHFLQEYLWAVVSLVASLFAFLIFVHAGGGLLFVLGRDERQRDIITEALDRRWIFLFIVLAIFAMFAFIAFPGFQQDDVGNGYWFWLAFTSPFILHAVASECLHRKPSSAILRRSCQWVIVVCGLVIPYIMGFVNCAFYTGTGEVSRLNVANGFFVWSFVQTGALLYLFMVIDDEVLCRRTIRILAFSSSLFVLSTIYVAHIVLSMDGLEYCDDGLFHPVHMKYLTNLVESMHALACSILGICLILVSIVISLFAKMKKSFWYYAAGLVLLFSSFIQIAGFNNTPVFPCYSDPQRSLSLANSCASEPVLALMAILSLFLPVAGWYLLKLWHKIDVIK